MRSINADKIDELILRPLTDAQREAVTHVDGPLLILAGPGSGKTRVITHRVAFLLSQGIPARNILALTFTNKAADEMRTRLNRLAPQQPVWMGTFHRFCARLLRQHASLVGLQENYSIYDAQDARRALKEALIDANVDLTMTPLESIANSISWAKNEFIGPDEYAARRGSTLGGIVERVYPAYQRRLLQANAADFDDLLLLVARLLRESPELRVGLDERYRYVMVDEYQDTNMAQYVIARALSRDFPNLAVAGDPDQSIYGWRGANLNNILDFEHDFNEVRVVRLEQNYRSTPNILRVADVLIANNVRRKQKRLFTDRPEGAPVRLAIYPTGRQESDGIAGHIAEEVFSGRRRFRDFAVFYRVNALSRSLENALRAMRIPYQIVNGQEFYQRKEVKDVLAYLQLVNNPANDVALRRVINTPPRGIGKKTLLALDRHARDYRMSLMDAVRDCAVVESLSKRAVSSVGKFVKLLDGLRERATENLETIIKAVLLDSGYYDWLADSESEEDQERLDNVEELLTAAREFDEQYGGHGSLEDFLEQTALVADTDNMESDSDRVTLMTMHAAKGLEFPVVFIIAAEEGLLPHERSRENDNQLEEERRLLFVGITRAEDELQISMAQYRAFRGQQRTTVPSPFLMELPREDMQLVEPGGYNHAAEDWSSDESESDRNDQHAHVDSYKHHVPPLPSAETETAHRPPPHVFKAGMPVEHPDYGTGTILEAAGKGNKRTVKVRFFNLPDPKTFRVAHSPLVPGEVFD